MPIECTCGLPGHFRDLSDQQPFKAFFVAEQDTDRLLSKMVATAEIVAKAGDDWTKSDPEFASLLDLPRFQLGNHVTTLGSALSRVLECCSGSTRVSSTSALLVDGCGSRTTTG